MQNKAAPLYTTPTFGFPISFFLSMHLLILHGCCSFQVADVDLATSYTTKGLMNFTNDEIIQETLDNIYQNSCYNAPQSVYLI